MRRSLSGGEAQAFRGERQVAHARAGRLADGVERLGGRRKVARAPGGVRKLRFGRQDQGRRGGSRVVYYYLDERLPLYALLAYAKSDREDLTPDERRQVASFAREIKATVRETR